MHKKDNTVIIKNNFLPLIFYNRLKQIVTGNELNWFYQNRTLESSVAQDQFMFTHQLCRVAKGKTSPFFEIFEPIKYWLAEDIEFTDLIRMKLNLYTNQNKRIEQEKHHDLRDKSTSEIVPGVTLAIFNFTTCNGGTIINDKEYASHENEALIFSNNDEHGGIVQTDTPTRIALNIAVK